MGQADVTVTLAELRAHAIDHTLLPETTPRKALARLPFVQADPICAPARAQDLILCQRVKGYRAGDLERQYPKLELEEASDCSRPLIHWCEIGVSFEQLPLLWRDQVIGWGNVSVQDGKLDVQLGFAAERPSAPEFETELESEIERLRVFLGLG